MGNVYGAPFVKKIISDWFSTHCYLCVHLAISARI